jgi:FkbM family methyltransferase
VSVFSYKVGGESLSLEEIGRRAAENGTPLNSVVEGAVEQAYKEWCKPGDIAIDCGAAWGRHTFGLWMTVKPTGHVYGFDALPERIEALANRAKRRRNTPLITFRHIALGNRTGTAIFTRVVGTPGSTGYSALKLMWQPRDTTLEEFPVSIGMIDDLIRPEHRARIAFIKTDLEGGDFDALRGGSEVISRSRPLIVSEFSGHFAARAYGFTEDEFFRFFSDHDYAVFDFFGEPYAHDAFNAENMLAEIVAVPNEKMGTNIHQKVAEFMVGKLQCA